jgi:hypothetical protein
MLEIKEGEELLAADADVMRGEEFIELRRSA